MITRIDAIQAETVTAVERGEVQAGRKPAAAAKDHVGLTGIVVTVTTPVGIIGPHQHVVVAVAVDVAGDAHRTARKISRINAVQAEAVAAVERGEV